MNTILSRRAAPFAAALMATVMLASAVAAGEPDGIGWTAPVNVRNADGANLQDADFAKRNVAIAWQEPGSGDPTTRIRTSVNGGNAFGPAATFPAARQAAVDICGASELRAAYARRAGPANWVIERATGGVDGGGFAVDNVSPGAGVQRLPDIACAGGRAFVSWFEGRDAGGERLRVAHERRSGGGFSTPISLGIDDATFFGRSLAVAGVGDRAYAVFSRSDGRLRFTSWSIGDGPGFAVTPHPVQVIGGGTTDASANEAVIAAAGNKVAVAWVRCNALLARVSNDRGQTWGPVRNFFGGPCIEDFGAVPRSIAIRGDRIALTYIAFGIGGPPSVGLIRTTNDFASSSDETIGGAHDEHLVGYVTASGTAKLAAAFDRGDRIQYRRQQ